MSWGAIAQIESGRRRDVRLTSLSALAGALGVPIDYLTDRAAAAPPPMLEHRVLVYGATDEFLATIVPFLREGIERSEAQLVVTTAANIASVRENLRDDAVHVEFVDARDWYSTPLEALRRYRDYIDDRLADRRTWVRIVGEPVWSDRSPAEIREWTRYESIINMMLAAAPATIICPYDTRSVPASVLSDAGCTHPQCAQPHGSPPSGSYREPEDFLIHQA